MKRKQHATLFARDGLFDKSLLQTEVELNIVTDGISKSAKNIIFLLSDSRPLFEDLSTLLYLRNSEYAALFIESGQLSLARHYDLSSCDMVLCDMNGKPSSDKAVLSLFNRLPALAPVIGLAYGDIPGPSSSDDPSYLRLAGIIMLKKGWDYAWDRILELRRAWKSPYMHSYIEEVSPSDVLQMIGVCQWTAIVRIEGTRQDSGSVKGCISFCKGIPECAWSTNHTGINAIWDLLSVKHGTLDVVRRLWPGCVRNVRGTIEEILITHALGVDQSKPAGAASAQSAIAAPPPVPAIYWPDKGPRRTLESFWNKHREAIAGIISGTVGAKEFPLRWMKWRELERLVVSEIQTQFLVFYGSADFIKERLGRFAPALLNATAAGDAIPVIRTGKIGNQLLYLIGIHNFDMGMRVLSRFPFIINADVDGFRERFSAALKSGVQALILVSSRPRECLVSGSEIADDREWNACCIAEDAAAGREAAPGFFIAVAEALSRMAAEKNA